MHWIVNFILQQLLYTNFNQIEIQSQDSLIYIILCPVQFRLVNTNTLKQFFDFLQYIKPQTSRPQITKATFVTKWIDKMHHCALKKDKEHNVIRMFKIRFSFKKMEKVAFAFSFFVTIILMRKREILEKPIFS